MTKQTIVTITDENLVELKKHSVQTLNGLVQSLQVLKANITDSRKEVRNGAIVITAAIAQAVEEAINQATAELKKK